MGLAGLAAILSTVRRRTGCRCLHDVLSGTRVIRRPPQSVSVGPGAAAAPAGTRPPDLPPFPVVLASDLIYEMRNVEPVVGLIKKMLRPDGLCLLTDQDRVPSQVMRDTLTREELPFSAQTVRAGEPGGRRVKGTLYRITRAS